MVVIFAFARRCLLLQAFLNRVPQGFANDGLVLCRVKNEHGALHACLAAAAEDNLAKGRIIRDILVGIPEADDIRDNVIPVHIYSEQVRSVNALGGGQAGVPS